MSSPLRIALSALPCASVFTDRLLVYETGKGSFYPEKRSINGRRVLET